jgi:uncharacterized repeat protein (TIGR03803 family)
MLLQRLQSAASRAIVVLALTLITAGAIPSNAKEKVLYAFTGGSDGNGPNSPLIFDNAGNLYGTTVTGGADGYGTVLELKPSGSGWTETVLYSFVNLSDGVIPIGPVLLDKKGNLYGLTQQGGPSGYGTAFELSPNSNGGWTKTTIHAFAGGSDGISPYGGLVADSKGNLYGFTLSGGSGPCQYYGPGCGTIFELKRSHGSWKEVVIFSFPGGSGGQTPIGLTLDEAGNFFGTTSQGGSGDAGIVFKLSRSEGGWTETILHAFTGGGDGSSPSASVTLGPAGNLYGTASEGSGGGCTDGCGLVYELEPIAKGRWKELVLHRFTLNRRDGVGPIASLIFDQAGNLFGTTSGGGAYGLGIVFELMQDFDGKWKESVIQDFARPNNGFAPGTLVFGRDGYLYGSAAGGAFSYGLVFQLSP